METIGLKLSDAEQRYFGELFTCCDVDNQGKIAGAKASELFLASQLSTDTLHQITELCGAKRLGHFGRSQFYIALKLISAAQAGLPLKPETFNSGVEIPLPKFGRTTEISTAPDIRHGSFSNQLPGQLPPPPKGHIRTGITQRQGSLKGDAEISPSHQSQTQLLVQSSSTAPNSQREGDSHGSSPSEIPPSPKPHLLHGDKSWAFFNKQDGHLNWAQFEEHHHLLGNEEDSSERHSSDEEYDIWTITDEQQEYYINQFKSMQPELKGRITGAIAKEFFEKSKLPVHELSKIWQLSDVDKDGALTIEEFCTAMHLVVLRRNNIELPETLPPSLIPEVSQKTTEEIHAFPSVQQSSASQHQGSGSPKPSSPPEVISPQNKEWTKFNDSPTSCMSSPGMKPVNFDFSAASVEQDPRILHPVAVRLSPDGQPIPYTNEVEKQQIESLNETKQVGPAAQVVRRPIPRKPAVGTGTIPPPQPSQSIPSDIIESSVPHSSVSSFSGSTSTTLSQSSLSTSQGPKKEPPPPPPPRPKHNHARSSSLDLNRLGKTVPHFLSVPPVVPPRVSPSTATPKKVIGSQSGTEDQHPNPSEDLDFADFTQFDDPGTAGGIDTQPQLKPGAFEIYKKPFTSQSATSLAVNTTSTPTTAASFHLEQSSTPSATTDDSTALLVDISQPEEAHPDRKRHLSAPPLALAATSIRTVPRDKRELQSAIRAHRERNMMLSLANNELNQELAEVMEERIALEIQLEHLKPFS